MAGGEWLAFAFRLHFAAPTMRFLLGEHGGLFQPNQHVIRQVHHTPPAISFNPPPHHPSIPPSPAPCSIAEACTAESCPVMCAGCDPGPVCEYQWADGVTFKKVRSFAPAPCHVAPSHRVAACESQRSAVLQLPDGVGAAAAGRRGGISVCNR